MKKLAVPFLILGLIATVVAGQSGSSIYSNYREVTNLSLIRTIGIDKDEQVAIITAGSGTGLHGEVPNITTQSAYSVPAALSRLQYSAGENEPFVAHTSNIVVGEEVAKSGMTSILDYTARSTNMRLKTGLFVVRGGTAQELITETAGENSSASDMLEFLERNIEFVSEGAVFNVRDVIEALARDGCALVMAVELGESNEITEGSAEKVIIPAGFAVIKGAELIGYVPTEISLGVCILTGNMKGADIVVDDEEGLNISLRLTASNCKARSVVKDKKVEKLVIDINIETAITECERLIDPGAVGVREALADKVEQYVYDQVCRVLDLSQEMGVDFTAIGRKAALIRFDAPLQAEKEWREIFPDIELEVNVSADIHRTFDLNESIDYGGEGG